MFLIDYIFRDKERRVNSNWINSCLDGSETDAYYSKWD